MKNRFNTIDTIAIALELQKIKDARVNQIYDVDNKTYLIKLNAPDSSKITLLFESGIRIHTTKCDWPKNSTPSGFTMKLRKHIRNKRIIKVAQLGCDRIIQIQFGDGTAAYHLFLEFFNRGNIVLADHEFTIVSLLRVYSDGENYHFANKETYPVDRARERTTLQLQDIEELIRSAKKNDPLKKCLLPKIDFGLSFLEHCLKKADLSPDLKITSPSIIDELHDKLALLAKELSAADDLFQELLNNNIKGYISYVKKTTEKGEEFSKMIEFNPYEFIQNLEYDTKVFDTFTDAVDEYFSKLESQKLELSVIEKENEAMRKVNKIRADQESRLQELSQKQLLDKIKADRILSNADLVEDAIKIIRSSIAAQMSWGSIKDLIIEAKRRNDPIATFISNTKFEVNQISMTLNDPFAESEDENDPIEVDIDLALSAHANATRYYDHKKHAAIKEKRTIESQKKALKSAERKAREILKTAKTQVSITVSRKVFWFEKFFWFISSDNYLVIAGRDQKQNELIVKRYMKQGDLYVHADLIGASSVVIKNPSGAPVPPRTLDEAGHMAVCYSNAWDTKIICRAWWVYSHQVSKTAPAGEYLVTGSFMIRGQKNYILPTHLQLGFSFIFKIEESSAFRHADERKPKGLQEASQGLPMNSDNISVDDLANQLEEELYINDDEDDKDEEEGESEERDSAHLTSYVIKDQTGSSFNIKCPEKLFLIEEIKENINRENALVISLKDDKTKDKQNHIITESENLNYLENKYSLKTWFSKCFEAPEEIKENINTDNALVISFKDSGDAKEISTNDSAGEPDKTDKIDSGNALVICVSQNSEEKTDLSSKDFAQKTSHMNDETSESLTSSIVENNENIMEPKITEKSEKNNIKKVKTGENLESKKENHNSNIGSNNKNEPLKKIAKEEQAKQQGKLKRGQKSKLKKIKEKYKDQDEEEKQLRMSILQSAGPTKKSDKKSSKSGNSSDNKPIKRGEQASKKTTHKRNEPGEDNDVLEGEPEREVTTELDMLVLLTGQPHPDDELLYALPVVAPYNSVLNNKFKMKIIPGTSKRGKAARTALEFFMRSKECTSIEKELLKCVPDQSLSRNFPGKVKLLSIQQKKK